MPLYPTYHAYRVGVGEVQVAASVLLLGMRQWVAARRQAREDGAPVARRRGILRLAGCHHARTANARCDGSGLSDADDGAAGGQDHLAAKVLRDTLLSAPGGEFVLGPPTVPARCCHARTCSCRAAISRNTTRLPPIVPILDPMKGHIFMQIILSGGAATLAALMAADRAPAGGQEELVNRHPAMVRKTGWRDTARPMPSWQANDLGLADLVGSFRAAGRER